MSRSALCCARALLPPDKPTMFFFFNDTATTEIYTLSLHDAFRSRGSVLGDGAQTSVCRPAPNRTVDRKSTRLNSSHVAISYAVFCLKKKNDGPDIDCAAFQFRNFLARVDVVGFVFYTVPVLLLAR